MGVITDIIKGCFRTDGYVNLVNRYGTGKDASEHYEFSPEQPVSDVELTFNYEGNGLFAKIIDIPADDAASGGIDFGIDDKDMEAFINDSLDELDYEDKVATAMKWSRLYGGAIIVMMVDDGGELTDPLDWDNIHGIDELLVFERPLVTPDYNSIYNYRPNDRKWSKFGMPEYYDVSPVYGSPFRVHESRCLLFRNGTLPQSSSRTEYRFFGIPEYMRVHKALQETVTSHGSGVKLLDRAVQAIYKMANLSNLLETEDGEDSVLKRLEMIDLTKGIINSIAIDKDEDYDYKTVTFTGVKDIIDSTCNMLSAITNIPQTKLFGRSPAGENATGEGDMENYYTYVGKIQKLNIRRNLGVLLDIILQAGRYKGEFTDVPDYRLTFEPLWSESEAERANTSQVKASTELTKAQTAQIYVDMQALDYTEVRRRLAEDGEFTVNDILDEEETDWNSLEEMRGQEPRQGVGQGESQGTSGTALSAEGGQDAAQGRENDSADPGTDDIGTDDDTDIVTVTGTDTDDDIRQAMGAPQFGCGVIVIKGGRVLVGTRKDNGLTCGPGGHIEPGETPEEAAIRETREEFGIYAANLVPVAFLDGMGGEYCPSQVFLCTEYYGEPRALSDEMCDARFATIQELGGEGLFLPFGLSIRELLKQLRAMNLDAGNDTGWRTLNGQHCYFKNGDMVYGNPNVLGGDLSMESGGELGRSGSGGSGKSSEKKTVSVKEFGSLPRSKQTEVIGGIEKMGLYDAGLITDDKMLKDISDKSLNDLKKDGIFTVDNVGLQHATVGSFSEVRNPKKPAGGANGGNLVSGGHSQANLDELNNNGIKYKIEKTYDNGVRIGGVANCTAKEKRLGNTGQSWFPESWNDDKVRAAGTYTANKPAITVELKTPDGTVNGYKKYQEYESVTVGIVENANHHIDTIFPDEKQRKVGDSNEWS